MKKNKEYVFYNKTYTEDDLKEFGPMMKMLFVEFYYEEYYDPEYAKRKNYAYDSDGQLYVVNEERLIADFDKMLATGYDGYDNSVYLEFVLYKWNYALEDISFPDNFKIEISCISHLNMFYLYPQNMIKW